MSRKLDDLRRARRKNKYSDELYIKILEKNLLIHQEESMEHGLKYHLAKLDSIRLVREVESLNDQLRVEKSFISLLKPVIKLLRSILASKSGTEEYIQTLGRLVVALEEVPDFR
jgi:hypothetical protein